MSRLLVTRTALAVAGIIHLLPLTGLLGPTRLEALYGIQIDDPNLDILLRHRAILFGILGAFLLAAAWQPSWRVPVITAGLASTVSFLVIAGLVGHVNAGVRSVVIADVLALLSLLVALLARPRDQPAPAADAT